MPATPEDLEAQLRAGAWLRPGAVARVFSIGRRPEQPQITRWTIVGWINANKIRYKQTPGGHRELSPEDVIALLDDYRRVRRASED